MRVCATRFFVNIISLAWIWSDKKGWGRWASGRERPTCGRRLICDANAFCSCKIANRHGFAARRITYIRCCRGIYPNIFCILITCGGRSRVGQTKMGGGMDSPFCSIHACPFNHTKGIGVHLYLDLHGIT